MNRQHFNFFLSSLSETFQRSYALSNDTLIMLSSTKKNATEARRICSSFEGSLAVFDNYDTERVKEVLIETYVKGNVFKILWGDRIKNSVVFYY